MFQHNTEGGRTNLLATLGKRSRLLQTRLAGTQWKVLVFGFAIPWKYYQCGATACDNVFDNVFDAELHVLFEKLKQKRIENFALVGLMIVHDVPAHACFQERRRVLSPEWTEHFQVAMRHIVPFSSTFHGAKFRGHRARQEMMALCKLLEGVRDQKYWQEAFDTVAGSTYHYNPHLSIRTWTKRSLHGLPQVGMAVETSCELVHDVTGELLPPGTQITILQIRQGDCNTDGYVEVKVLFSAKGVHCTEPGRLWLQRYLFRWGSRKEVSLIFCLGWNADAPQAENEYDKQVALVKVLQNSR